MHSYHISTVAYMSTKRARVQYGKASKRVNSRFTSEIVQIQPKDGETTTDDGGNQGGTTKEVKPRRNKSKDTTSPGLKELPTKRIPQRQTTDGSRASIRSGSSHLYILLCSIHMFITGNESRQDHGPRKRKRDASPASSELTDVVDEEAPAPKALKGIGRHNRLPNVGPLTINSIEGCLFSRKSRFASQSAWSVTAPGTP